MGEIIKALESLQLFAFWNGSGGTGMYIVRNH